MPPRKPSKRPTITVDYIYKDYVEKVRREKQYHVIEYLARQSEPWQRLYPETHSIVTAAIESMEKPPPSQIDADKSTPSNIDSVSCQPPQESPSTSTSSGLGEIQVPATVTRDITFCQPVETLSHSQIDADKDSLSNIVSICYKPTLKSPKSSTSSGKRRIQDPATVADDIAIHQPAKRSSHLQIDAGKDSLPNIAFSCNQSPLESPNSSRSSGMQRVQVPATITGDIATCLPSVRPSHSQIDAAKSSLPNIVSVCHQPTQESPKSRSSSMRRVKDPATITDDVAIHLPAETSHSKIDTDKCSRQNITSICHQPTQESSTSSGMRRVQNPATISDDIAICLPVVTQSHSQIDAGKDSQPNIASISHQSPKETPNSPISSSKRKIQHPATVTGDIALHRPAKRPSQLQICSDKDSLPNIASICHQSPLESLNSSTSNGLRNVQNPGTITCDNPICLPVETQSHSQINDGKDSLPNIASICHQSPLESLNSSPSSGLGEIQGSATITGDIGICKMSHQENIEVPFQSQSDTLSVCHQPSLEPLDPLMVAIADRIEEPALNLDSDTAFRQSQQVARDRLLEELECLVQKCDANLSVMPECSLDDSADSEHLRTFLTQITHKLKLFNERLKKSLTEILQMELSPNLNVSMLAILTAELLNAVIDVSKVWEEFTAFSENSISDVQNFYQLYISCLEYYAEYQVMNDRYLNSLPEELYLSKR